jgi:hypothetical protein
MPHPGEKRLTEFELFFQSLAEPGPGVLPVTVGEWADASASSRGTRRRFGAKTNAVAALHLDDDSDALIVRSDWVPTPVRAPAGLSTVVDRSGDLRVPEWYSPRGIPLATIDSGEGRQEEEGDTSNNGSRTLFVTRSGPPSPAGTGHRFGIEAPPVLLLAAAESGDLLPSLAREPPGPIPFSSAIFFEQPLADS